MSCFLIFDVALIAAQVSLLDESSYSSNFAVTGFFFNRRLCSIFILFILKLTFFLCKSLFFNFHFFFSIVEEFKPDGCKIRFRKSFISPN